MGRCGGMENCCTCEKLGTYPYHVALIGYTSKMALKTFIFTISHIILEHLFIETFPKISSSSDADNDKNNYDNN
jgi:hypothetical protein